MSELSESYPASCVDCAVQACATASSNNPDFCPMHKLTEADVEECVSWYQNDEFALRVMQEASASGSRAFSEHLCRVEETMDFARRMGYRKIGIAACSGLAADARMLAKILRTQGYEVYGIACKMGAIRRSRFDAPESCCDFGTVSCNPLMQAKLLNEAGTDFNIVLGLCVGHDTLFYQHSKAPCTTMVVKDRALANNPVSALHVARSSSPYNRMLKPNESFAPLAEEGEAENSGANASTSSATNSPSCC